MYPIQIILHRKVAQFSTHKPQMQSVPINLAVFTVVLTCFYIPSDSESLR